MQSNFFQIKKLKLSLVFQKGSFKIFDFRLIQYGFFPVPRDLHEITMEGINENLKDFCGRKKN